MTCPPRFATPRNLDRRTLGPAAESWSMLLTGSPFMPWQRLVDDVGLEVDDAGRLWYEVVILIVPRQSGKTTLDDANRIHATRRGPDRTAVYSAQTLLMARTRLLDDFVDKKLARSPAFTGRYRARRSNGDESVKWTDAAAHQSAIRLIANTDDAGHGLTIDHATIDEAFSHRDLTVVTALDPTMLTRPDPQLWIISTIGDGTDGLLQHFQEVGAASLGDPGSRVAYFEWSATDDDDRADPAVWRRVMPALGYTQTEERIARRLETTPPTEFDRSYLCRRAAVASNAKLDAEAWAACALDDLDAADVVFDGPLVAAASVALDRTASTIAVAGHMTDRDGARRYGVVIDRRPGTAWVGRTLAGMAGRRDLIDTVADRRAGAGSIIDDATARGATVTELAAGDVVTYCGTLEDAVTDGLLAHTHDADLDDAVGVAVDRPLGDAWAWSATGSDGPIDAVTAVTWAVGHLAREAPLDLERFDSIL